MLRIGMILKVGYQKLRGLMMPKCTHGHHAKQKKEAGNTTQRKNSRSSTPGSKKKYKDTSIDYGDIYTYPNEAK